MVELKVPRSGNIHIPQKPHPLPIRSRLEQAVDHRGEDRSFHVKREPSFGKQLVEDAIDL